MDFVADLGLIALGSRLRRLSDRIMKSGALAYRASGLDFEPRWFPLFRLLVDHAEGLTVGESARMLGLTHAAVSQTASKMHGKGLIDVAKDAEDERRRVLSLSEKGREMLPALTELWRDIEMCLKEAVHYGGVDILAAAEGLESALQVSSLSDRIAEAKCERTLKGVEMVNYCPSTTPALGSHFKRLNFEWLEKYFVVEPVDEEVLSNPNRIIEEGGAILFATIGDEVVGTCALQLEDGRCELIKMAVTEGHRGKKIGAKLLEAALAKAVEMKFESIFLVTNSTLTPAINLYRKFGFRVVSAEKTAKYERGDLVMEREL